MPDGKILSGSETGHLLMWEGGFIKAVIAKPAGAPCHGGAIEALLIDQNLNFVVSGGNDGVLRLWDVTRLNEAENGVSKFASAMLHVQRCWVRVCNARCKLCCGTNARLTGLSMSI